MCAPHFVYTFIYWTFGLFPPFDCFVNNDAMNVVIQISVRVLSFSSFRYIPRSVIARSCGNSMFNFLRTNHTVFRISSTISHYHEQCIRVCFPHPFQHLLFSVCFVNSILMGEVILWFCLAFFWWLVSDIQHLFIFLLAICISSLEKCLFRPFPIFKLGCLFIVEL